ncbi:MAG: hypothetical protein ACR2NN_03085 [Bryobacteraceae bacterium]
MLIATGCARHRAHIVVADAAASVWDDKVTVGTQLQLENVGSATARQLRVTRVKVKGGSYKGSAKLPVSRGDGPEGTMSCSMRF